MKTLTLFLIFLSGLATGQGWSYPPAFNEVITDSIVWRLQSIDNPGDSTCQHEWVYGPEQDAKPGVMCGVLHHGYHCDWTDQVRSQICRLCLRKETYREQWYQHRNTPPKSEYEILDEKISGNTRVGYIGAWDSWVESMDSIIIDTIYWIKP